MRFVLIFLLCIVVSNTIIGQHVVSHEEMEEKLIKLALEHYPTVRAAEHKIESSIANYRVFQFNWTDQIVGQYNLNEANINPASTQGMNIFYPKYLFGLRLTLGNFIKQPFQAKMARENVKISSAEYDLEILRLKNETKRRYTIYTGKLENYKIREQSLGDMQSFYKISVTKFEKGELKYEEYSKIQADYLMMQERKNIAEMEYKVAKFDLEELIGIPLEQVEQ